jgi:uncharacterized protein (DUF169 family)
MTDFRALERSLTDALQLTRRPVAVSFHQEPPQGIARLEGTQPSGCSFWRLAADGRAFYTVPADHYNCPVGSYTHNIPLPKEREQELGQTLSLMSEIGYIRMEEVPSVPQLPSTPPVTVYAPLGDATQPPDVIIVSGRPGRLMLLHEAALRASKSVQPLLGRPTCMAIPATVGGGLASSFGCIGNRIYTDVADDEFYTMLSGRDAAAIVEQLSTIASANATLADYHRSRRATIATI